MPIKMTHEEHGAMHAYTKIEVKALEAQGWVVAPPKVQKEEPFNAGMPFQSEKRKPGRPRKGE